MPSLIPSDKIKLIAKAVSEWPDNESLTWDKICNHAQFELGYVPTRQALSSKPILKAAYKLKKSEIKSKADRALSRPKPKSLNSASDQIYRLKEENQALKDQLVKMNEMAMIMIKNAYEHGLTKDQLFARLSRTNRSKEGLK
ncbi:hypothetical protein D3C78_721860 [compost metagenome]